MNENCKHLLYLIKDRAEYIYDVALNLIAESDTAKGEKGNAFGIVEETMLFAIYSKLRDLADEMDGFLSGEDLED